ncbi:MAG: molecular chaperone DnaJ [Ruminococcaceae bacterium]|nr:molecular chaperone DnaJ [Oscillospiraceae bacterium]
MNDPYKVLGVAPNASDEEIKKAYRTLARKYHPDNYAGTPMAELAEEKMKEINQAYEAITKARAAGESVGGDTDSYDVNTITYAKIRRMINTDRIDEANAALDYISPTARGAEWNFLKGCILVRRGWYYDAQKYFETACYLAPDNEEYMQAVESLKDARGKRTDAKKKKSKKDASREEGLCAGCADKMCSGCCECLGGNSILCC